MPLNLLIVAILLGGWLAGRLFTRLGLPTVLGMVVWGALFAALFREKIPPLLGQVDGFLKSFALIVILLRAGLGISKATLQKSGRAAILMSFVPCVVEGGALTFVFHLLFGFSWEVAGLTGFLLAAVSPAVVVPSMLALMEEGYGRKNEVPTVVLAGASADDVFAITIFSVFLQAATSGDAALGKVLVSIPLSLLLGIVPGVLLGLVLVWIFRKQFTTIRATEKALILMMIAVVLVQVGDWLHSAALLGVMTIGFILLEKEEKVAHELAHKFARLWVVAEILLFVLIGMAVDLKIALGAGLKGLLAISIGLVFRVFGVFLATMGTTLTTRERLFCAIAYIPKATVQAALGGAALAAGVAEGATVLAIAVLAIVFTAPLGLVGIKVFGKRLLDTEFSGDSVTAGE